MGHVMRTLTLASALRGRGLDARFVMRALDGTGSRSVDAAGFGVTVIPGTDDEAALDASDTERVLAALEQTGAAGAIVDHYGAGQPYFERLAQGRVRVGAVDDLAAHPFPGVDWIVNPAPGFEEKYETGPRLMLGPRYALLRQEFTRARVGLHRKFDATATRILITLGGGDVAEWLAPLLDALNGLRKIAEIRCTISEADSVNRPLRSSIERSRHRIETFVKAESMAELMDWAELSIGAAGQTVWELCCMGVPMVVTRLADNQNANASGLLAAGAAVDAGEWNAAQTPVAIVDALAHLVEDSTRRKEISGAGMALVDGMGASRVADEVRRRWLQ